MSTLKIFSPLTAVLVSLILAACGGGDGSGDAGNGTGSGTTGGTAPPVVSGSPAGYPTGFWHFSGLGRVTRYDFGARHATEVEIDISDEGLLGYGGGLFTTVLENDGHPTTYTVNLRRADAPHLQKVGELPPIRLPSGDGNGNVFYPVMPSPDASLFVIETHESPGLGEDTIVFVTVIDAKLKIKYRVRDYGDPIWLDASHLIVTGADGFFILDITQPGAAPVRIGEPGLGLPGGPGPGSPSLSPDRRSIAYTQGSIIWRINLDGSGLTRLTIAQVDARVPMWSPDGSQLVAINGSCAMFAPTTAAIISATAVDQDLDQARNSLADLLGARVGTDSMRHCTRTYWLPQ